MSKVSVRVVNQYDADAVSRETAFACEEESLAQQQFKDECDINTLVKRFGVTGLLPEQPEWPAQADFTHVGSFQECMQLVKESEAAFMSLPADVRERFGHEPGLLLEFLYDPKNRDEAVRLGIVAPAPEKTRGVVEAVDELAANLLKKKE